MCKFCTNGTVYNPLKGEYESCTYCNAPNTPTSLGNWSVEYTKSPYPEKDVPIVKHQEYIDGQPVERVIPVKKWWER